MGTGRLGVVTWAACLSIACAGTIRGPVRGGGEGSASRPVGVGGAGEMEAVALEDRLGEVTPRQRASEAARATAEMWRVLAGVSGVGAEVEFSFWVHRGALTMVAWRRTADGRTPGVEVPFEAFARTLRPLATFAGGRPGTLRLVVRREAGGWALAAVQHTPFSSEPSEARTLPVDALGIPAGAFAALEQEALTKWLPLFEVPADGRAWLELTVEFEDAHVLGASERFHAEGHGVRLGAPPGFETELAGALVPFAQGIGRRKVRVQLEASREHGDPTPRWRIREAATVRPARGEPDEAFTTGREYRRMHEEILRQWREGVVDAATLAASFTAEQIALWIVGGMVLRGVGAALDLAEGPLLRVLGRSGPEAADWLACLLKRLPKPERDALTRLWTRMETEGLDALTVTERSELRAGLQRLEQLAKTPLTRAEKNTLRDMARDRLWGHLRQLNPDLPAKLVNTNGTAYQVHHKLGLEWAHLAPEFDVNALQNLAALEQNVHESIGRIWMAFRKNRPQPSLAEIKEVVAIVDRHYGRWYNVTCNGIREHAAIQAAQESALAELHGLLTRIKVP